MDRSSNPPPSKKGQWIALAGIAACGLGAAGWVTRSTELMGIAALLAITAGIIALRDRNAPLSDDS